MRIKEFKDQIGRVRKAALDTMCFVYFFEENRQYLKLCQEISAEQEKRKKEKEQKNREEEVKRGREKREGKKIKRYNFGN